MSPTSQGSSDNSLHTTTQTSAVSTSNLNHPTGTTNSPHKVNIELLSYTNVTSRYKIRNSRYRKQKCYFPIVPRASKNQPPHNSLPLPSPPPTQYTSVASHQPNNINQSVTIPTPTSVV